MTKVKICGITSLEDALVSIKFGADMIGFNFFPGSKRYIDKNSAESIVERLAPPVVKVGVFVNQSIDEIMDAKSNAELDIIQLHGEEQPEFIDVLRNETAAKIIKVFRVGRDFNPEVINNYSVDGIMLDSYSKTEMGGTGETFDWDVAAEIAKDTNNLYLAGGLNPGNVAEAIRVVRPYAVDVASGVESSPGKKDAKKLEAFIANAKSA